LHLAPPSHPHESNICCDWKGRATSAQSFTLWQQAREKNPRRAHFISACWRHMGVVHHTHRFRGESHIHHNAERLQHLQQGWVRLSEMTESAR